MEKDSKNNVVKLQKEAILDLKVHTALDPAYCSFTSFENSESFLRFITVEDTTAANSSEISSRFFDIYED